MNLIAELKKIKGCRLVRLLYRTKGTGELSDYLIALGVRLENAYRRDDKVIRLVQPRNDLEKIAKEELLSSLQESLRVGIGNNSAYTCKGVYKTLFNGCKIHPIMKTAYIYGFIIRKHVIETGEYPEVKSKPLTIAKNRLRKKMKITRFRQFELDHIKKIVFEKKVLTLE